MKRTALVTGGAGFIGSHLTRRLLDENWEVIVLDNLSTGFLENIPKEASFLELDLSSDSFVEHLPVNGVDCVFHLAAQSSGEISFEKPAYDLKTNALGTLLLLDWCKRKLIKRFLFASSMSIYGDIEELPVKEDVFPVPKSFYGVGKLSSESYLRIFKNFEIDSTSLRFFNVYGPGQNMDNLKQGMVSIYMAYIASGKPVPVKGPLERFRDFIFIDDVIDVFMLAIDNPVTYGKTYNVGTGKKTTIREILTLLIETFGHDPKEYPVMLCEGTPGDQFGIYADCNLLQADLGWAPKMVLSDGLVKMRNWIRDAKGSKKI